jgi:hypothetical protein
MDPDNVSSIVNYPAPRNVRELNSFLGLVSWCWKYVPNFSDIITSLTGLLNKNQTWDWSEECQNALDKLKLTLISVPILYVQTLTNRC